MVTIKIKNYELPAFDMKQASTRKALQFKNMIITNLKKLDVHEDFITVKEERVVIKRAAAKVSWYMDGQNLFYSYTSHNYIQNLYIVSAIIELEVNLVLSGEKSVEEFVHSFNEDKDVEVQRKEARTVLGVSHDSFDFELITKKYKDLSKTHHPDMGGDLEMFQKINIAHKTLKKELLG
ncbi:J domain-containing protein [Candidatus Woesearchaeota archaeon]|nr:J domain-containing protein [Candidatus Woesearchaeota archaeon]